MQIIHHYFTSNQDTTSRELGVKGAYSLLTSLGQRLQKAMGDEEILSRYCWGGGEFRVPTYRAYAESLNRDPWTVLDKDGREFTVISYQTQFEGWKKQTGMRSGLLCTVMSSYEFAYELWDEWRLKDYHPDLFQDGTFGVWLSLLPQPVSVILDETSATISWGAGEPRVHKSEQMGRYLLSREERTIHCVSTSWRRARAEAYVMAWERMAANEPADRYKQKILASVAERDKRFAT